MTLSIDEFVADIDEIAKRRFSGLDLVGYESFRAGLIASDLEPESVRHLLWQWVISNEDGA